MSHSSVEALRMRWPCTPATPFQKRNIWCVRSSEARRRYRFPICKNYLMQTSFEIRTKRRIRSLKRPTQGAPDPSCLGFGVVGTHSLLSARLEHVLPWLAPLRACTHSEYPLVCGYDSKRLHPRLRRDLLLRTVVALASLHLPTSTLACQTAPLVSPPQDLPKGD
jgi:hypothetical protein